MEAYLSSICYYLPSATLNNEQINLEHPEWSIDKIASKTGIYTRHISAEDEFSSDMAETVGKKLLAENESLLDKIDYLILCTQSPDYFLPTTACILQSRLGLKKSIGAIDFNLGCSGFVYGLGIAKALVVSKQASNVLLITAETYSKFIHEKDKSNKTLFGDAAAACIISNEPTESSARIGDFVYGTDGDGAEHLIVRNGGMRNRSGKAEDISDDKGFVRNDDYLFMNGKAIFEFTVLNIPTLVVDTLSKHGLQKDDIDLYVFHQANDFMLQTIRKRIGIPSEKFYIHIKSCGNTVSSTIPIALNESIKEGKIKKGDRVLLAGFGVGLSWGATVLEF